jgi:DNA-binding response OmpR family regulator
MNLKEDFSKKFQEKIKNKLMAPNLKEIRILLVEDEETLAAGLEYNLNEEGYAVKWAKNGKEAIEFFTSEKFDLIVLDIMLPYIDGFEVAERVRMIDPQMPILMLTAKTESADKVKGLEKGADDYLTKPFHLQELLLRIKGMLKRKSWYKSASEKQPVYNFGNNKINFENLMCSNHEKEFRLTPHEAMVLKYLIEHKGEIVSRKELLENVWHLNSNVETRTVDIFIGRLRKYFETDPGNPRYIKSIRGSGYLFKEE